MKPSAIICLILFILNTGLYAIYQLRIFRAKWNASQLIRKKDQQNKMKTIRLSAIEAKSYDQDEINYRGVLFDVVKRTQLADSVLLVVYPDKDEQNILTELVDCFSSEPGYDIPLGRKIFVGKRLHPAPLQFSQSIRPYQLNNKSGISKILNASRHSYILSWKEPVPVPPPKYFFQVNHC